VDRPLVRTVMNRHLRKGRKWRRTCSLGIRGAGIGTTYPIEFGRSKIEDRRYAGGAAEARRR
jgi:hypothetical protein